MCAERTPEESRRHSIDAMGEELGALYHELSNELSWLHLKWREYVVLFGTKPSRIELINEAAGDFFRLVQDALMDDVLLHIARLTDRPGTAGRANLTIQRLPTLVPDDDIRIPLNEAIAVALSKSEFARDWRNRRIAHRDLALALSEGAEPLRPASRAAVKEALAAVADALNRVAQPYTGATTIYSEIEALSGASGLLYVIADGLERKRERRSRFESGDYSQDDFKPRDL